MMYAMAIIPLLLVGLYAYQKYRFSIERSISEYAFTHMSEDDKQRIYALIAEQSPGIYDSAPEPLVGRLLQKGIRKHDSNAEIISNDAGMRSKRPYTHKEENVYRIICLGDSLVYGQAGKEEDRLGDQIEEILSTLGVTVNGKRIEVYSIGIPSWTGLNEAAYLSTRISEYAPDLVFVLMVANDIDASAGVTGTGKVTVRFSPEYREYGPGVFFLMWPKFFGEEYHNLLKYDLGPESRALWEKTFAAWKRLETLSARHGGKMVFGILERDPLSLELCKFFFERNGLTSPLIVTNYLKHELPHDAHPDRKGHRIMALHYLHTAANLGWLPVKISDLPVLNKRLDIATSYPASTDKIQAMKKQMIEEILEENIVFNDLTKKTTRGFLGGIFPYEKDDPLKHHPYGTLRTGFLLKRRPDSHTLFLEIDVPPRVELYPFNLEMYVNAEKTAELNLENEQDAGRHVLRSIIPKNDEFEHTVEVILTTESYWATINDFSMLSYRLISASQE